MKDWFEQSNSQPNRDILPIKLFHKRYIIVNTSKYSTIKLL